MEYVQNEELPAPGGMDMSKKSLPISFQRKWANHPANIDIIDTSYVNLELSAKYGFLHLVY